MGDTDQHHGHRARLRQRFARSGFDGFGEHEIVELILTLAIPRSDVKPTAKALLRRFKTLRAILDATPEELAQTDGIGTVAPIALKIIKATAALYLQQSAQDAEVLSGGEQLADFWRLRIGASPVEVFEVAHLDSAYRVLREGVETLEHGTVDRAAVYPRKVVEAALKRGAYALAMAHNHPNGDTTPSEQDKILTRAIVLAAEAVGVRVVDHLIVTPDKAFSFRRAGLL